MSREFFRKLSSRVNSTHESVQCGFTLIELLAVIGIIGLLAAIAVVQYGTYRKRGFIARATTDLRTVATAEEAYFTDYQVYKSCANNTCVAQLPDVLALSPGITLQITATTSGYTGTASHPQLDEECSWDNSQAGFLGCS